MNLNDKVNFILDSFSNSKQFWNMGTDPFGILTRLYKKTKQIDVKNIYQIEVVKSDIKNNNKNDTYQMLIDGVDVTPISTTMYSSKSAIKQYIKVLRMCGILFDNEKDDTYSLPSSFKNTIEEIVSDKSWRVICQLIKNGTESSHKSSVRLTYSLFLNILKFYQFDWMELSEKNRIVSVIKQIDGSKKFDIVKFVEKINWKDAYKKTYKQIVENTCKQTNLETLVNFIFEIIQNKNEQKIIIFENELKEEWSVNSEIHKFKKSIEQDRKSLGLLKGESGELYSDLEIYEENNFENNIVARINDLEAAHIFDKWRIKEELEKKIIDKDKESIKSYAIDPKNGLLMCVRYHRFFDKKYFNFNIKGEMIYNKENEKYLFDDLKLYKVRIRPEIMDEKMINFLSKRVY